MKILIRADASETIGTGHIMRCLALAQCLQKHQYQALFLSQNLSPSLKRRIIDEGLEVMDLGGDGEDTEQTIQIAKSLHARWVILDGYQFGTEHQKQLKEAGLKVLFFDDYGHCQHYYADLVLNQNIGASQVLYRNRESYTKLLLGSDYTLLRKEFLEWQQYPREIKPIAAKILVTLGGADPENVTLKVIQALVALANLYRSSLDPEIAKIQLDIKVIVGGNNPHFQQLTAFCQDLDLSINLLQNVTDMPTLMAEADVTIAAGGSTNWELAFMGLPSLVITIADNQKAIAAELDRQGFIVNLGWHQDLTIEQIGTALHQLIGDRPQREVMSKKGRALVDGNGTERVVEEICHVKICQSSNQCH